MSLASVSNVSELPINYTIYCYPLYNEWNVGTGRTSNSPITTNGASWEYVDQINGTIWYNPNNLPNPNVAYYDDGTGTNNGGGLWYFDYETTQTFINTSPKDIELNVSNIINTWFGGGLPNNGFILKHANSIEFSQSPTLELKYFSGNTHTIYPPCLEIRWDDSSYNTGSLSPAISDSIITIGNNKSQYNQDSVQRFKINVRDRFPARAFQSTSVYLINKALPETSYYLIKDLDTEEIVVDYDTTYTKISCDPTGNYFDIYMNGLEPERYYKILIKTIIGEETIVFDDNYYFKVIR